MSPLAKDMFCGRETMQVGTNIVYALSQLHNRGETGGATSALLTDNGLEVTAAVALLDTWPEPSTPKWARGLIPWTYLHLPNDKFTEYADRFLDRLFDMLHSSDPTKVL